MKFGEVNRIILFGGSDFLAEFANLAKKNGGLDLLVFSSKRHIEDRLLSYDIPLGKFLKKINVPFFESRDINSAPNLKKYVNKKTLGVAFGAAWIFEKKTVGLFAKNNLLDFMGIDLPRYRGGAHYSWQILNKNRVGAINLQIIEGGLETFHGGNIIKKTVYSLPTRLKSPQDFFEYNTSKSKKFIKDFLRNLKDNKDFPVSGLDETKSSYYPFLSTEINGLINWGWNGKDIALFIDAFDDPYKGASTFLNGRKVFLRKCMLLPQEENYHPFSSGLIIRKDNSAVYVATSGNLLKIEEVLFKNGANILVNLELGDRFYTPSVELEKSNAFKAAYNWKGLVGKK